MRKKGIWRRIWTVAGAAALTTIVAGGAVGGENNVPVSVPGIPGAVLSVMAAENETAESGAAGSSGLIKGEVQGTDAAESGTAESSDLSDASNLTKGEIHGSGALAEDRDELFREYAERAFEEAASADNRAGEADNQAGGTAGRNDQTVEGTGNDSSSDSGAEEYQEDNQYEAPRYNRLTYKEKEVYLQLKKACRDVADGRRDNSVVLLSGDLRYFDNDNYKHAIDALLADCPYEMYWYSKEDGVSWYGPMVSFCVDPFYSKTGISKTYEVNTSRTGSVQSAINRAKSIAAQAANMSDYDALRFFKDQICDLVSYDDAAAEMADYYGINNMNPWQLIYVFDGDPSTNVVCEGYAKAFKFLCDLYGFTTSSTDCYIVTGTMYDSTGGGGHMWNMVHWYDGRNYMVDVTNCDGYDDTDRLFLVGSQNIGKNYYNGSYRTTNWWINGTCWDYYIYYTDGTVSSETLPLFTDYEVGIASRNLSPSSRKHGATYPNGMGWLNDRGDSFWYEHGVRQGTLNDAKGVWYDGSNRGREIYDPSSDGWYWLDSIYDGAKAIDKEVLIPYIYSNEAAMSDAEMRNCANASDDGMRDYVYNAMKNRSGKWVRYDHNGKMMKGWVTIDGSLAMLYPSQAGNTYYYDNKTGLMAKGWITMGGRLYHFDEQSGKLLN